MTQQSQIAATLGVAGPLNRTARFAGLSHLGLAIFGVLGFVLIRGQLYQPDDALATAANLVEHEGLARLGIAADFMIVITQSFAALFFFKLFRNVDAFAAGAIAAFGLMNAIVILASTIFTAAALEVALEASSSVAPTGTALLLYDLSAHAWNTGGLFFGLWLIPMGWMVLRSGWMPRLLGWILIVGGFCRPARRSGCRPRLPRYCSSN